MKHGSFGWDHGSHQYASTETTTLNITRKTSDTNACWADPSALDYLRHAHTTGDDPHTFRQPDTSLPSHLQGAVQRDDGVLQCVVRRQSIERLTGGVGG